MYFTQIYPFRENARYKTDVFFLLFLGLFAVGSFLLVTLVLEGERRRYYLPVIILYIYVDYLLIGTVRRVIYLEKIVENDYENVEPRKNPFIQLERFKKQDLKLQNWLNFSLGAARKDKRKRKQLFLKNYFSNFKNDWSTILNGRGINLNIDNIEDIDLRIFEIDIDSIFNNLLVNSIEAFSLLRENRDRLIRIKVSTSSKEIIIDYADNGPGLSPDIVNPDVIFDPLFTTRRNSYTGEEEGTGLGMWLVKSIIKENDGIVKLLYPEFGFGVRILFPIKYRKQED